MASPYILSNGDLQYTQAAGQDFKLYLAFLNPVSITTTWRDLSQDAQGNWLPPPNFDTAANHVQPYAPICNLGPNRIGFVGEPLYFDGGRSCQRFDIPVVTGSYTWTIAGQPSVTYYANKSQVGITWPSPGLYTVSLRVKDRAGTPITGTRQVMIYPTRQQALPGVITVSGLSGSLSNGGWQLQITTVNSQVTIVSPDSLTVGQYLPVVLLAETSYEVQKDVWVQHTIGPHGLFNPGYPYIDPRVLFDGYIQNGSIHQDVDKDTLSFTCAGPQMILQEAKTHQLGYYNCAYTSIVNGVPTGCKTSPVGNGFQVGNLMTTDVIASLLQYHCNIATYHDIHMWIPAITTKNYSSSATNTYYCQIYTTLSTNEGTIWQNMQDLTTNEFSQVYCERDGSIRVGPQVNYRGADYWSQPTLLGGSAAPFLINLVQDLGYSTPGNLSSISTPTIAAQPMPVTFVHQWGHQLNPPQFLKPFGQPNFQIQGTQAALVGPPVLCTFSDVPLNDTSSAPPDTTYLYPWVTNNWPQDLAVYPISMDFPENYTGRASLVKLIGTLYGHTTLWSSWWPRSAFSLTGNGTVSVVSTVLPAGDWVLDESHVLPDVTTRQSKQLVWNYWWEMARRYFYAHNSSYTGTVTVGMFTGAQLGDIVAVTRQNISLGSRFSQKLFSIQEIDYTIDLTSRTWQSTFTLEEVTSATIGGGIPAPQTIPSG